MTKGVSYGLLEVLVRFLALTVDVLVDPPVDSLWVNLKSPDQPREHLNAPWVPEHVLDIRDIHTELIGKAALDFKWNFA